MKSERAHIVKNGQRYSGKVSNVICQVIGLSGDRNFVTHLQKFTEPARKKITQITQVAGGGKAETMKISCFRVYR